MLAPCSVCTLHKDFTSNLYTVKSTVTGGDNLSLEVAILVAALFIKLFLVIYGVKSPGISSYTLSLTSVTTSACTIYKAFCSNLHY